MNVRAGMFTDDFGNKWSFFPPPPTVVDDFRIGDRVRLIGHPYLGNIKTGEIVDRAAPYRRGDWEVEIDDYGGSLSFREDEMEHLTAPDVRAGRYYKNRSGVVVGPMETDDIGLRAYVDGHVRLFAKSGEHLFGDDSLDLVEEVAAPVLRIEAGKYYRTRDGRKVGPAVKNAERSCGDFRVSGWNYDKDGACSYLGGNHRNDIISEWPTYHSCAAAEVDNLRDEYGPVVKAKFKVGDRVNIYYAEDSDNPGTVTSVSASRVTVEWDEHFSGMRTNFRESDLRLVAGATSGNTPAIVARLDNGQPRPSSNPFVHSDRASAEREAARLAKMNVGKEFAVYEFVSVAREAKVYEHEWQRLAVAGETVDARKALQRTGLTGIQASRIVQEFVAAALTTHNATTIAGAQPGEAA